MNVIEQAVITKAQHSRSSLNVMLTIFFDFNGVGHFEIFPQKSVNKHYEEVLKRLHKETTIVER